MRFRRFSRAAVVVLTAAAALVALSSPSEARPGIGPYQLFPESTHGSGSDNGSKCVEVPNASTANGTGIDIWTCGSITPLHHRWWFDNVTSNTGAYYIYNGNDHKCMNIKGAVIKNSTPIVQWTCSDSDLVLWDKWITKRKQSSPDYYQIQSYMDPSYCLNIKGNATANNTALILYKCSANGTANDLFRWTAAHN